MHITCMLASHFSLASCPSQARRTAGEELLPEEDPAQFKPLPEPSLLNNYLLNNQLSTYCDQLNIACTQSLQKLYVFEGFAKSGV